MKVKTQKVAPTPNLKLSESLSEAFNDVQNAVNEGVLEIQKIDEDIKALQAKLKSLNFQGMDNESQVQVSGSEELAYSYSKKDFFYKTAGAEGRKLIALPTNLKKQIHEYYLPELLSQIASDYKNHRASMG